MNQPDDRARRAVLVIGTVLGVLGLTQAWRIGTDHLGSAWPDHAKWHAVIGGLFLALLAAILLVALWGPYRERRSGIEGLLALLLAGPAVAVIAGMWLLPAGSPGGGDTILAAVATVVGVVTALFAWRARV